MSDEDNYISPEIYLSHMPDFYLHDGILFCYDFFKAFQQTKKSLFELFLLFKNWSEVSWYQGKKVR